MPDVWGGFATGARRVLECLLRERMLAPTALVLFNACDRSERLKKRDQLRIRDDVHASVRAIAKEYGYDATAMSLPVYCPISYQPNMQTYLYVFKRQN